MPLALLPALLLLGAASAQRLQSSWGQCGGSKYTGPTACPKNNYCNYGNPWYSQCVPGTDDGAIVAQGGAGPGFSGGVPDAPIQTASPPNPIVTTYISFITPGTQPSAQSSAQPTAQPVSQAQGNTQYTTIVVGGKTITLRPDPEYTAPDLDALAPPKPTNAKRVATPTTLSKGQYWIRAVEAPNFHKYLQTSPANTANTAILGSSKTAGQFNIVDGQLIDSTGGTSLYLNVEKPTDLTQRTLATWFNATKNEFGTFVFQGDAVTWSTPEIKRQNLAAWLVCKNSALYINTGAYGYQTPSGCSDETIHFYNGDTAND
ncbi:hypothetical protein GQ53DRAFT_833459 [Thozetella sp. PMI_491]|nr:hypothetical protein GQ53DRAFT_833459 [Thozetella sp. PMI_491]